MRESGSPQGEGVGGRGPDAPPTPAPPPHSRPLRNGNPAGNPNLAPRCGARNRAGCPCRAPAMPNGRCRVHGGKSTGPRTPKGIARTGVANTRHGRQSAPKRAAKLYLRTLIQHTSMKAAARRLQAWLPKELAARLAAGPLELWAPIHPTNLPFVKNPEPTLGHGSPARLPPDADPASDAARRLPRCLAAERQAARAEAAALAPWREAITVARAAKRAARAADRTAHATRRAELADKRTARQAKQTASAAKSTARHATRTTRVPAVPPARPSPLDPPADQYGLLQCELAARKAGLRMRISEPHQPPATDTPKPNSTFSRIYPMNPETAAAPAQKPNSVFSRIFPMNPETTTPSQPTRLTPASAAEAEGQSPCSSFVRRPADPATGVRPPPPPRDRLGGCTSRPVSAPPDNRSCPCRAGAAGRRPSPRGAP